MIRFLLFFIICSLLKPHNPRFVSAIDTSMVVNVLDYGAQGDGITNDTMAFMGAWYETCQSRSPAIMYVPKGFTFLVYPILFSGPCNADVSVEVGGKIIAPHDPLEWNDSNRRLWIGFENLNNFLLMGGGVLDGQGYDWWSCVRQQSEECPWMFDRPTLLRIHQSTNVKMGNLRLADSPSTHVNFHKCVGVEASNLEIVSPSNSPNTDGIHVHRSKDVSISNCSIASGDDCISIGTGSIGLKIQNIFCGPGHGISIGSLGRNRTAAYVSGVDVNRATISDTRYGVRIKTWQGGSGFATNIIFRNIVMYRVRYPILINQYYCIEATGPCSNETSAVRVSNVKYRNIKGTSTTKEAIRLACSDTVPCTNISMQNIDLTFDANGDGDANSVSFCQGVRGIAGGNVIPHICFD